MSVSKKKKYFIFILRLLAVMSLVVAGLNFYDYFSPNVKKDIALVSKKRTIRYASSSIKESAKDVKGTIIAQGQFNYDEVVDFEVYDKVEEGDQLQLTLTPIYMEWKQVRVFRNGNFIFDFEGTDIVPILYIGLMLLLPIVAFVKLENMHNIFVAVITTPIIFVEILSTILFLRLALVFLGMIPKM